MATLNEIVQVLAEKNGTPYDVPFKESMKSIVNGWRAVLIRQTLQRHPEDRKYFLQSFTMALEEVDVNVKGINTVTGHVQLVTVKNVPVPLRSNNIVFDYVGSPIYSEPYGYVAQWWESYMKFGTYTGKDRRFAYDDSKIKLFNVCEQEEVGIVGIFDNPTEVGLVNNACYNDDLPYPVNEDIKEMIIRSILAAELRSPQSLDPAEIQVIQNKRVNG